MNASVYLTLEKIIETGYNVTYGLLPYEQNNTYYLQGSNIEIIPLTMFITFSSIHMSSKNH